MTRTVNGAMNLLCIWLALAASTLPLRAAESALTGALGAEPFTLQFSASRAAGQLAPASIKAGSIWKTAEGGRFVVLRSSEIAVADRSEATVSTPAAALSSGAVWTSGQPLFRESAAEPRLAPLLDYLAQRNDIPRETSQLVVLALVENINFADWQKCAAAARPEPAAAPTGGVAVALDALTILRTVAPKDELALASDGVLKLRALHDPLLRGKALQLFGLVVPGDAPAGGVAPDLGQLLHTKPGDNCPICRLRGQMQRPADVP